MPWSENGAFSRDKKFLVDLEKHTYISDKSHQEIIDRAGLHPGGYDNYLKGWVKQDGTIKLWVENIEDVVFRYWDQIKLAFRLMLKEQLTSRQAKTFAIVNRIERFAGKVHDFLATRSKNEYFENQLGYAVHFYGQPKIPKGSPVMLLVNYKLPRNRYLLAGTRGRLLAAAGSRARHLRVKWQKTRDGYMRSRGGVVLLTDRRLLTSV